MRDLLMASSAGATSARLQCASLQSPKTIRRQKSQAQSRSAELRMLTSGSRLAVSRSIPATDDHKNHTATTTIDPCIKNAIIGVQEQNTYAQTERERRPTRRS